MSGYGKNEFLRAMTEARRRLSLRGYVTTEELAGVCSIARVVAELVHHGEVVQIGRSSLYAEPKLASEIVSVIAARVRQRPQT